jgi:hypothetical protein
MPSTPKPAFFAARVASSGTSARISRACSAASRTWASEEPLSMTSASTPPVRENGRANGRENGRENGRGRKICANET